MKIKNSRFSIESYLQCNVLIEILQEFKIEQVDLVIDNIPGIADVQDLPPTPPSSGCSDNESSGSASCSPKHIETHGTVIPVHQNVRGVQVHPKVYLANSTITTHTATRHPIHTPLISCQPVS